MQDARSRLGVFAFVILHLAFVPSCAKTPPPAVAQPPVTGPAAGGPPTPTVAIPAAPLSSREQLASDITALTQAPGVRRGTWGIAVRSLDRKERLFELNAGSLLVPASITKLLAVATAVDAVGWDHRFVTTLGINGTVVDGVLHGDLVVSGTGDPSIGGRAGDDLQVLIDAITSAGIRRIDGRIIGDDNALEDPRPALAWAWDDLGYPTGAMFGALNYGENRTVATIAPGTIVGAPGLVTLDAMAQGRPIVNRTVTVAAGATQFVWAEQRPGESALTIAGTVALGRPAARLNISAGNPTLWFASVLRNRLITAGIPVTGEAKDVDDLDHPVTSTPIYSYRSPTLADIARPIFKDSVNLYAEAVMRLNSAPSASPRTNDTALEGFKARMSAWGISPDAYQVIDGSGLSRRDAVSAEAILAVLERMHDPSATSPWMRALPVAGIDGSLEARMRGTPAAGNVRAKTGTMSNIRSLAGYVTTADGERLAFVVMLNDFEGSGAAALQAIDGIAVRLATFRR